MFTTQTKPFFLKWSHLHNIFSLEQIPLNLSIKHGGQTFIQFQHIHDPNKQLSSENLVRCTTQNEKGLVLTIVLFTLYFDPHKK